MFARSSGEGPNASLFRTWTACFFVPQLLAGIATTARGGTDWLPVDGIRGFEAQSKHTSSEVITCRCVARVVLDANRGEKYRQVTGLRDPLLCLTPSISLVSYSV